jgi:hypothetical protein
MRQTRSVVGDIDVLLLAAMNQFIDPVSICFHFITEYEILYVSDMLRQAIFRKIMNLLSCC